MFSPKLNWSFAILLVALISASLNAQAPATGPEWETVKPEGEEFTVLLPKNSSAETTKFLYHKMELTARLYLSSVPKGPVLAVASFNGIKSNPALYTEFQRFNSYVDAFKTFFPGKVRPKDAIVKLTQVGNNTFHGYDGREFKMTIGDLSGTVFAYATKKRFYTIVSLNIKKDDALQDKFLSSFSLPDKPAENERAVAVQQEGDAALPAQPNAASDDVRPPTTNAPPSGTEGTLEPAPQPAGDTAPPDPNAAPKPASPGAPRAPISGGVLNAKAIYLPQPEKPAGEIYGTVLVQVLVDEQGTVIAAKAVSGPPQLQQAAVNAARFARFTPTMLMGEPVKVSGTLTYSFVRTSF